MSWLGHNKCSIFTNRLTDLIYPEHWMTLQKKIGNWGTKSCLEFENPIQNTEETWILVKLTCSVTELDYVKVFGREPSTGFGKRGNEAVGPLWLSGELSFALCLTFCAHFHYWYSWKHGTASVLCTGGGREETSYLFPNNYLVDWTRKKSVLQLWLGFCRNLC